MKNVYYLLVLCASLAQLPLQAQNWRPFRPNQDVHAFRGVTADTVLTMRLDSAALQGADSVYYFNRTVRRANSFQWQKSANNQFGRQLRYNPAQRTYSLNWAGVSINGFSADRTLVLKPFARVGDTWSSYFSDYGVQTTLLSRGTQVVDGVTDSVAIFRCSTGVTVMLSKNNGLVSAPANLLFGVTNPKMLTIARRPGPAGLSYYNPLDLLDLQPGNELGYFQDPVFLGPFACFDGWLLRRVLSRQVTADSVVYRFQQQSQTVYHNTPSCSGMGTAVGPVEVVRMAASLRTGRWAGPNRPNAALVPVNTDLLAYEYRALPGVPASLMMGYPVLVASPATACSIPARLQQQMLYRLNGDVYNPYQAIDLPGWQQQEGPGVGVISQAEKRLVYWRRTVNAADQTCGSRTSFGTLLPTKAARLAATFELYPNPAGESATLRLAGAARVATTVRLLDNLGRAVKTQQLTTGQTELVLPLQSLVPGLYLVEVQAGHEPAQYLKLQHSR
ncbi:T9SS type A sorting domain-containing protein [Hymenobacter lucidus]|uniref:T9SS type A sorting domain-containing protein n=1 Tax=Hymenobacter lucidus TaxID=2880930 RepID=A0ABS8AQT4_9BACT|nr:T9SS type A sorting domain-containing protein [Hymenobacter lucidus]MCB2408560.1 T9SS type A sorting domain-containing protein [Hymenobacter lucidus]